jgi:hypothetical protein
MAADIFTKHFITPHKWVHAKELIGVLSLEQRNKLLVFSPAPMCVIPKKIKALAGPMSRERPDLLKILENELSTARECPPISLEISENRFVCSLVLQFCPIRLVKGSIQDSEICDFCKFLHRRTPAMAARRASKPSRPQSSGVAPRHEGIWTAAARSPSAPPRPAPPPPAVPGSTARERHSTTTRERHAPLEPPAPERHQNSTSEQELEYLVEHERLLHLLEAHERKNPVLSKATAPVPEASSAASVDRVVPIATPAERLKAKEAARQTEQKMRAIAKEGRERTDELRRLGAPIAKAEAPILFGGYGEGYVKPKPKGPSSDSEPEVAPSNDRLSKLRKTTKSS